MALHEHLVHAGDRTEVAVNLERRVRIEQVVVRLARGKEHANHRVGMVAVVHAGPKVDFPSERPAGRIVTALFQRNAGALDQIRSFFRRNLRAREEAVQVRNMAVLVVRIVPILEPFRNLSVLTGLCRRQALDSRFHLGAHIFINAQNLGSLDGVIQHVADNLVIHRGAKADVVTTVVVFRGIARGGHQILVAGFRFFHEAVHEEERSTLHGRINVLEVSLVGRIVEEMFPEVRAEPAGTARPEAPGTVNRGAAVPEVGIVVFHPALVYAPVHLRGLFALRHHRLDLVDERPHAFAEVRRFHRPVVHFEVDVRGVLAAPNRIRVLVPDSLQVGRLPALARTGDEQVTAILVMELYEGGVVCGIEILHAGACDVACALVGFAQIDAHAVENRLVILEVRRKQVVVGLLGDLRHDTLGNGTRIGRNIVVGLEVRRNREHERRRVRSLHIDVAVRDRDRTAVGNHVQAVLELDGIDGHIIDERVPAIRHLVVAVRGRHGGAKTHGTALISRQAHHNHVVRIARKILAGVFHAAHGISRLRDGRLEVEFTAVIAGTIVRRGNHQVAHRLETGRAGANHVVRYDGFRGPVVAAEHGVAGIFQVACRTLLVVVARAARPYGTFVQADDILRDATVDEATHVAVADGECIRELATRIAVIPEG